jgi:hypothetical protein
MKALEAAALSPGLVAVRYDEEGHVSFFKLDKPDLILVSVDQKDTNGDPLFAFLPAEQQIELDDWEPEMETEGTVGQA